MITKPANYAIFSVAVVLVSILVFPFPIRLLEMYSKAGEYDLASQQAAIITRQEGENRSSLGFRATQASLDGDPARLIHYLKRLDRISLDKKDTLARTAQVYMWSGQPEMAAQTLEETLKLFPKEESTLEELTSLYQLLDQPENLTRVVEERFKLNPADEELADWLMSLYAENGQIEREMALRLDLFKEKPEDAENAARLGGLYLAAGKIDEGLDLLAGRLGKEPGNQTLAQAVLSLLVNSGDERKWRGLKALLLQSLGTPKALAQQIYGEAIAQDRTGAIAPIMGGLAREYHQEPEILKSAVELHLMNNQPGKASELMAQMARLHPDDPVLARSEANLLLEAGDNERALKALRRMLRLRPDAPQDWQELFKVAGWSARPDDAIKARLLRLELFPSDTANLDELVKLAQDVERYDLAKETLQKLGGLTKKDAGYVKRMAMIDQAISWQQRKNAPPGQPGAHGAASSAVQTAGQPQTAPPPAAPALPDDINELRRLVQKAPKDAELFDAYLAAVEGGRAGPQDIRYFERLVGRTRNPRLLSRVARAFVTGDMVLRALPALEKLARIQPANQKVRRDLAKYYSWTGKVPERLAVLKELSALTPADESLRLELFEAALGAGDKETLLEQGVWLQARGRLKPAQSMDLAELHLKSGNRQKALALCRSLLRAQAGAQALARAGWMALDQEEPRLAVALFSLAVKREPRNPEHLKNLASAQLASGQAQRAVLSMRAYTRRIKDYGAHFMLGEILSALGRNQEARIEFNKAHAMMAKSPGQGS